MVFVAGYLRRAAGRSSLSVVVSPRDEGTAAKFPAVEEVYICELQLNYD